MAHPVGKNRAISPARWARLAAQALLQEAELTPKPGLVDRRGSGAHRDLTLDIMRRSVQAIEPFFAEMAVLAARHPSLQVLREGLAGIGRRAEKAMLQATHGSNAHKGAIWAIGLLTAAATQTESPVDLCSLTWRAAEIARCPDRAAPQLISHGQVMEQKYGVAGAKGEAREGFPTVVCSGLPMLRRRRLEGASEDHARLDALLAIMSVLDDTCLLFRGGIAALTAAKQGARTALREGGSATPSGIQRLLALDKELLRRNASPGGSADLLAATFFLDSVASERMPDGNV
jgi:triphosphoribosyl-dephospho-CoA synthase